jgi:protein-S-isoprenylcysteine O-methyltransferase Ste14
MKDIPAYGLWSLVIINSLIFIIFAFSFTKPNNSRDWRSFGAFSAFIVALFTEMYGFPLTLYLLSGWLQTRFPKLDIFAHDAGHLWWTSNLFIFGGLIYLASAWEVLYKAQRSHTLATAGAYATIRHPQYVAFILIMFGFLVQWPTILTLLMFPILVAMYIQLARQEERDALAEFGEEYARYTAVTPAFFPWGRRKLAHLQESHHEP